MQFLHQIFNVPALLLHGRRTQAGDATDQWRDQWNADISQGSGSVATHLRYGGIFSDSIIGIISPDSDMK